jgi:hypothetical protein
VSAAKRRTMKDLLAAQSDIEDATEPEAADHSPAVVPGAALPDPHSAAADGPLTAREQGDLATCEAALDNLRVAFAAAGKALQVIRDARLYRDTHATFEAYVGERWDMSRPQAYRLIDAWPLAQRLSPMGDKLNERQVRELLPLAERHGQDAAAIVYQAVADADGVQVTAALLHGAVSVLAVGRFDEAEAVAQIRAYLAGTLVSPAAPASDPVEAFTAEAGKLLRVLHRVADRGTLRAAADQDPGAVQKVIADMRAVLDEIEQGTA